MRLTSTSLNLALLSPLPLGEVNAKRWVREYGDQSTALRLQSCITLTRAFGATSPRGRGSKSAES